MEVKNVSYLFAIHCFTGNMYIILCRLKIESLIMNIVPCFMFEKVKAKYWKMTISANGCWGLIISAFVKIQSGTNFMSQSISVLYVWLYNVLVALMDCILIVSSSIDKDAVQCKLVRMRSRVCILVISWLYR